MWNFVFLKERSTHAALTEQANVEPRIQPLSVTYFLERRTSDASNNVYKALKQPELRL